MGMLVLVPAFGLVLAGCATTPPTPETLAVQLAADINALRTGSATADGATVRFTGEVYLKTGLTVPAGVTLDLTADGARFELQNNAELTVDGTVNTSGHGNGWVEGGLRIGDGTAVINGSGTINLKSKGSMLNFWSDKRHLTLEGVTLAGIKDNDNSLVQVGGGGEFVMKSGVITGNERIGGDGGGVQVGEDGTFTMEGGTISGNTTAQDGGGVNVGAGTFTLSGGTISNNAAERIGGGVNMGSNGSSFTMTGGTISGNTANHSVGGAGLLLGNGCIFNKTGGIIYGDTDNFHTPGSTENTVTKNGGESHAVFLYLPSPPNKLRKSTAGEGDNMSWDGTRAVGFDGTSNAG